MSALSSPTPSSSRIASHSAAVTDGSAGAAGAPVEEVDLLDRGSRCAGRTIGDGGAVGCDPGAGGGGR